MCCTQGEELANYDRDDLEFMSNESRVAVTPSVPVLLQLNFRSLMPLMKNNLQWFSGYNNSPSNRYSEWCKQFMF